MLNFQFNELERDNLEIMFMSPEDSYNVLTKSKVVNIPHKRKLHIRNVAKSSDFCFELVKKLYLDEGEREFLFQSISSDLDFCAKWFRECSPTELETSIIINKIAQSPAYSCEILSLYKLNDDNKKILLESVLVAPIFSGRVLITRKDLTNEERELLFNVMISDMRVLPGIFEMRFYLRDYNTFNDQEWNKIINKVVENHDCEIASLITDKFKNLPHLFLERIEHLVLINKLNATN